MLRRERPYTSPCGSTSRSGQGPSDTEPFLPTGRHHTVSDGPVTSPQEKLLLKPLGFPVPRGAPARSHVTF